MKPPRTVNYLSFRKARLHKCSLQLHLELQMTRLSYPFLLNQSVLMHQTAGQRVSYSNPETLCLPHLHKRC